MLYLVAHGVPWEIAENLDDAQMLAFSVIIGEQEGGEFSFEQMRWVEKSQ